MPFVASLEVKDGVDNGGIFLVRGWVPAPDICWGEDEAAIVRQEMRQPTTVPAEDRSVQSHGEGLSP